MDIELSVELRGWYHLYEKRLVQNEIGHRFYLGENNISVEFLKQNTFSGR